MNKNIGSSYAKEKSLDIVCIDKVLKEVKDKKYNNIKRDKRALIVLDLCNGELWDKILEKHGITDNTLNTIKKENMDLIENVRAIIVKKNIAGEEQIISRLYNLINKKLDILEAEPNNELLNSTRFTELADTVTKLFNKLQLEQGKPTAITRYDGKDNDTLKAELIRTVKQIEDTTSIEERIKLYDV